MTESKGVDKSMSGMQDRESVYGSKHTQEPTSVLTKFLRNLDRKSD